MTPSILIYTTYSTQRLVYAAGFIFEEWLGTDWRITTNTQEFREHQGPKINYSHHPFLENEIRIIPSGLLEETTQAFPRPELSAGNPVPLLFPHPPANYFSPGFDIFSAVFYMLSRYEEYGHAEKDQYGRFPATASLAHQEGFLHLPVVDIWIQNFLTLIQQPFPAFVPNARTTQVNFTYDIDVAYATKGRSWWRGTGAACRELLKGEWSALVHRLKVLRGKSSDLFDTYDFIEKNGLHPTFFFLLTEKLSPYDRNISPHSQALQTLVRRMADKYPCGPHPSYFSSEFNTLLSSEIQLFKRITGQKKIISRQHYLRFAVPDTFRLLVSEGISEDHSMAFAETPGFRAGTCTPFYFFDLEKNETSTLKILPPCIMDSTFRDDLIMPAAETLPLFVQYYEAVKAVGGHFISIWHNDTLALRPDTDHPLNFRQVHQHLIQYIHQQV